MIGHDSVRRALERELPPVTLIFGPDSVGKRTLVRHLVVAHGIGSYDVSANGGVLTIDAARSLRHFCELAPFGPFRVVDLRLDGASTAAQNSLLKLLEEPPATVRFLLTASQPVLSTILSRCEKYRVGRLADTEIEQILLRLGHSPAKARKAAALGLGQVGPTLKAVEAQDDQHGAVVAVMRAISVGDRDGFHRGFQIWGEHASLLLTVWLTETLSGQFQTFSPEESFGLGADRDRLMAMIAALSRVSAARPRLSARAALEPFIGK